jgi:hypothetical protein
MTNREAAYAALFARIASTPGLVTASRRLRHWTDVAHTEQPALFQVQKRETVTERRGLPPVRRLSVELYLFASVNGDRGTAPSQVLNPMLDAIEAALLPDAGHAVQTLGGLVEHAWIAGRIETDEGVLGDQAVAIVPVEILLP